MDKFKIYRGASYNTALGFINTNDFTRTSANTQNYYTLWMDNSEDWADYPKRSKSLICTNDLSNTANYGDSYIIIPEDNAKIGICPGEDLWYSFPAQLKYIGSANWGSSLDMFMAAVNDAFLVLDLGQPKTAAELHHALSNIETRDFEDAIKLFDSGNFPDSSPYVRWRVESVRTLLSVMRRQKVETMFDAFKLVLDPIANNFSATTTAKYRVQNTGAPREVWVQGKCLILAVDYEQMLKSDDCDKLMAFFQKHNINIEAE